MSVRSWQLPCTPTGELSRMVRFVAFVLSVVFCTQLPTRTCQTCQNHPLHQVLRPFLETFDVIYLDDILI